MTTKRKTTALAKRRPSRESLAQLERRLQAYQPVASTAPVLATLPSDPMMTASFVGTLKLKDKQIAALRRPLDPSEIDWKPLVKDGPPILPYVSHNPCRDRLDAAFGLGGWGMVPVGMPKEKDGVIYVPFAMVVDGVPRIYAWGEQAYHDNNKQMTYGDALEGAKSNAIVRCGKELGIGRELWTKAYRERLQGGRRGGKQQEMAADYPPQQPPRREPPAHGSHARVRTPITEKQLRRLWVVIRNSGRGQEEVKAWLFQRYGLDSTKKIAMADYEAICTAIESPGDLPEGPARQVGEEG